MSISCGDRVEIKGCQDLEWIPKIIRLEMARQLHMYRLANELRSEANLPKLPPNRSNDKIPIENRVALHVKSKIKKEIHDLTELFLNIFHTIKGQLPKSDRRKQIINMIKPIENQFRHSTGYKYTPLPIKRSDYNKLRVLLGLMQDEVLDYTKDVAHLASAVLAYIS